MHLTPTRLLWGFSAYNRYYTDIIDLGSPVHVVLLPSCAVLVRELFSEFSVRAEETAREQE